jgi:MFS transporter, ACS family, tartrate transporter
MAEPPVAASPIAPTDIEPIERETIARVAKRLLPLLMLGYFCAYLDRVNVGFAGLTMNKALGFSATVFGFGAGVFFIGYFLAKVPINLILEKVGARRWIARILITWGIISGLTAFVWDQWSFYGIRFLLGLAEAGFYPGIILYMTWWFPSYYRCRMMGIFQSASVISLIIGPIVSSQLLLMDGLLGLQGWQWLFIVEALPPVIMGFVVLAFLTDHPSQAHGCGRTSATGWSGASNRSARSASPCIATNWARRCAIPASGG